MSEPENPHAVIGDNSGSAPATVGCKARELLRSTIQQVEGLIEERCEINNAIREVYAEAKAAGFDTKTLRQVIALRKVEASIRDEQERVKRLYMNALGMKGLPTDDE